MYKLCTEFYCCCFVKFEVVNIEPLIILRDIVNMQLKNKTLQLHVFFSQQNYNNISQVFI